MAKVKVKTSSAAKKRFRKTGKGKIKRAKAFRRHLLTRKGPKRRRHLREGAYMAKADVKKARKLLPN